MDRRSVAAVLNISYLVASDNAADYRMLPVIIRADQCSGCVVQFQSGISQWIRNTKVSASSGPIARIMTLFGPRSLNDKAANHHVVTSLHKAASADIAEN